MTKHIHADLMAQYAQDALETDKPWERWEFCRSKNKWERLDTHPSWITSREYRRKPKTIRIGEYDVLMPERQPLSAGQCYFVPRLDSSSENNFCSVAWALNDGGDVIDRTFLRNGMVHLTQEAAELHAKALLSFTRGES